MVEIAEIEDVDKDDKDKEDEKQAEVKIAPDPAVAPENELAEQLGEAINARVLFESNN